MKIEIRREGHIRFRAENAAGQVVHTDGSPANGGSDDGFRPMELVLVAVADCAAIDVVLILEKARQPLADLRIVVEGERVDGVPAPFHTIRMHFTAVGAVDPARLERAVRLGVEKYCSVGVMLAPTVRIVWSCEVEGAAGSRREGAWGGAAVVR